MRLRNIPGARETIAASEYVVHEDVMREKKGKWDTVFEKAQPLYLEVGMGKGRFITELAICVWMPRICRKYSVKVKSPAFI